MKCRIGFGIRRTHIITYICVLNQFAARLSHNDHDREISRRMEQTKNKKKYHATVSCPRFRAVVVVYEMFSASGLYVFRHLNRTNTTTHSHRLLDFIFFAFSSSILLESLDKKQIVNLSYRFNFNLMQGVRKENNPNSML